MQDMTGKFRTPNGNVWYEVFGSLYGQTPIIMLHGGPGVPHDYLKPLMGLSAINPVIFYDQLGCGRSDKPSQKVDWSIDIFVAELELLRKHLQIEKFHLFGHSWGTILGFEYYLRYPEWIMSIVFASPCLSVALWSEDAKILCDGMGENWQRVVAKHESGGTTDSDEYASAKQAFNKKHLCRLENCGPFQKSLDDMNTEVYLAMWGPSEFTATGVLKNYDRTSELHEINVPCLFTCGRYDEARPETVEKYSRAVKNSKLVVFEQSSHMTHLEENYRYMATLEEYYKHLGGHDSKLCNWNFC